MFGMSYYLISFDYNFETYVWNDEIGCFVGEKSGNKLKCPCNYSGNYKYTNKMPECWKEFWEV